MNLNVDTLELRLYLAVVYDRDQLVDLGLGEVTHTSRFNRGPKPGITTPEILSRSHDTISKFIPPQRSPSNIEKRLMTKLALEYLMRVSLEIHIYSFNGYITAIIWKCHWRFFDRSIRISICYSLGKRILKQIISNEYFSQNASNIF